MSEIPVIIGAGPAGIRAAQTLVEFGVRPIILDEGMRWGGQIYRQQPTNFSRTSRQLYGFDSNKADALSKVFKGLINLVDYRPQSLVWNVEQNRLDVIHQGQSSILPWQSLIVATGATDRILPFPGWTLPGVFTMGATQIALKYQACAIGAQVILAGTGPLLYLVAYQYVKAGATVLAVLDTAHFSSQIKALPGLLNQPKQLARGMYYVGWLISRGIKIRRGIRIVRAEGKNKIDALVIKNERGAIETLPCDALGVGYALRPETQIADGLGCEFKFDPMQRAHVPVKDIAGRSSLDGVYLAGDGAGIMGADAAELSGELSALALVLDRAVRPGDAESIRRRAKYLESRIHTITRFRAGLETAFPCPDDWIEQLTDETIICRCEEITFGHIRDAITVCDIREVNRLKALSRAGMGRCQGRMCSQASAEILAHLTEQPLNNVGRLRGQPPIKPVPAHILADASTPKVEAVK